MTVDQVSLFLALLALLAQIAVVIIAVTALAPSARAAVVDALGPITLWFAAVVAAVAMTGSLYFSEAANFPPCRLCWYQRIAMYPLVPVLAIAAIRRDRAVRFYALPLVVIGAAIATYHVILERVPSLETGVCELTNPCTIVWVERLGYNTIPVMSLSAFVLIGALLLINPRDET